MKRISTYVLLTAVATASGCGTFNSTDLPPVGMANPEGIVIKGRATFDVQTGSAASASLLSWILPSAIAASGSSPVSTTLAASTSFALDKSGFVVPAAPVPFEVNAFGFLQISQLKDNDLKVCGPNGHTKCTKALIRMYTTGASGSGLYNAADAYGAPIGAGQTTPASVGLGPAAAALMQQITIPSNKNVVRLSDFTNPKYNVQVDFSDAGAGLYATTLVVEYAVSM